MLTAHRFPKLDATFRARRSAVTSINCETLVKGRYRGNHFYCGRIRFFVQISEVGYPVSPLQSWWSQSDQFDWVTTFLRQRGLIRSAQMILAIISLSAAWVPLTVVVTQHRRVGLSVIIVVLIVAFSVGSAYFWMTRWPTRGQSRIAVITGMSATAAWSAMQHNATFSALACTALAVNGGYIALFHSRRLLLINSAVAAAATMYAVVRIADQVDFASAAIAFWLIWFPNFSVPLIIWGMSQAMGTYVERAERDPLTGLLNRRAFTDAVTVRLVDHASAHTHLAVMMVDLDDFKRVNDTQGHSAGDRLLQVVAEALREHSPADGIICRAGGEEFLIALTCVDADVSPLASLICKSIAGNPSGITASIGTASAELSCLPNGGADNFVEELVSLADSAMYAAKRTGGNQAQHSGGR